MQAFSAVHQSLHSQQGLSYSYAPQIFVRAPPIASSRRVADADQDIEDLRW